MLSPLASRAANGPRPERRRYQRHALRCECWLEAERLTIFAPTIDVGIGGLFLRTAIPVEARSVVDLTLKVEGVRVLLLASAVVTRSVPAHAGLRHGVGLEFLRIEAGHNALASLLQRSLALPWG